MQGTDSLNVGLPRDETDRLFRETAKRQRPGSDGRLVTFFNAPKPGSTAEQLSSMASTAFGVFCIVGGLAMMLGMAFVPATGISLAVFAMIRVFMAMV
jgi:hypothetical protein